MFFIISVPPHNRGLLYLFQAFVRFSVGDKEITYVTKHSTDTGDYSFELDVNEAATDFGSLSNSYAMVSLENQLVHSLPAAQRALASAGDAVQYVQCCIQKGVVGLSTP